MDMLKTRHQEEFLLEALSRAKQPFVSDNTNPTRQERAKYISAAKGAGFRIVGYYFESRVAPAVERDLARVQPIGERGILGTVGRMERPSVAEGFDELFYVRIGADGFVVEPWKEEVSR